MWEESRRLCIGTEMMTGGVVQTAEFLLQVWNPEFKPQSYQKKIQNEFISSFFVSAFNHI
jgi:hypothetical protein